MKLLVAVVLGQSHEFSARVRTVETKEAVEVST